MRNKKHYQIVDGSLVYLEQDGEIVFKEIDKRLKKMFKGARFRNTCTGEEIAADIVALEPYVSEKTGRFFLILKANLQDVPAYCEIRFQELEPTLHYIGGKFVHVVEFKYYSGGGANVELLLPGETKHSTSFPQYVFENL